MKIPAVLPEKQTVLLVDDSEDNLVLISSLLKDSYKVKVANRGAKALRIVQSGSPPDLVLLDILMPDMDGYEVCQKLKESSNSPNIPIIFLTSKHEVEDEQKGLAIGAVDYITKPISPPILLARVKTHLQLKATADFLIDKAAYLEQEVARRVREVHSIQHATILVMASLAETRDNETGYHIRRTQNYVRILAENLRKHPRFSVFLDDDHTIDMLFKSAPLHDIGKIGIPDHILLKPGPLDAAEFEIMKTHTTLGRMAIEHAERQLDSKLEFLTIAKEIAYSHQEKWDGTGYPLGLSGDDIPISARLMAIADVYDALISKRVYKGTMSHESAVSIIADKRSTHFDPDVVDAFLALSDKFREIAERYPGNHEEGAFSRVE